MKKKFLMLLMCSVLTCSMITGCGNENVSDANVETESIDAEDDEDEDSSDDIVEEDTEEVQEQEPENEPEEDAEENVSDMPRSDAYDMFLAGEMDVTVIDDDNEYSKPDPGTYSYEELRDAVIEDLGYGAEGEYDIKYALFTPDSGEEGDDILVLYVENQNASALSWLGFIGYNNGKLEMQYFNEFGYRSYLDLYYTGDMIYGGSGGAGAHYQDYLQVNPDASVDTVYESAYLYASWCSDVFYTLDSNYDYSLIPALDGDSELEMTRVTKDGTVYICVAHWSDNKSIKEQEEAFVQALEDIGAVVVDEDKIAELTVTSVDESKTMTWNHVENVTVSAG